MLLQEDSMNLNGEGVGSVPVTDSDLRDDPRRIVADFIHVLHALFGRIVWSCMYWTQIVVRMAQGTKEYNNMRAYIQQLCSGSYE